MGQKVNPHGMRVGVIKDWDSRWFTSKQEFGDTLVEDHKIRKTLKKQLYAAGVPKIEIERTVDSQTGTPRVKVNVFCAKPGIVIGKGGAESAKIEKQLAKLTGKNVNLNIVEVKGTTTNAQLVAEDVASQLERRIAFRRAMKQVIRNAMQPRGGVPAKGIKVTCSGRLAGADIARVERYHEDTPGVDNRSLAYFVVELLGLLFGHLGTHLGRGDLLAVGYVFVDQLFVERVERVDLVKITPHDGTQRADLFFILLDFGQTPRTLLFEPLHQRVGPLAFDAHLERKGVVG